MVCGRLPKQNSQGVVGRAWHNFGTLVSQWRELRRVKRRRDLNRAASDPGPGAAKALLTKEGCSTEQLSASFCTDLSRKLRCGGDQRVAAVAALQGHVVSLSFDALGCRTVQLALSVEEPSSTVVDEVLGSLIPLCTDFHGHHVVEATIEHGTVAQQHSIAQTLKKHCLRLAMHFIAYNVLLKALVFCPQEDQQEIADALLSSKETYVLAQSPYGLSVVDMVWRMHERRHISLASSLSRKAKHILSKKHMVPRNEVHVKDLQPWKVMP